MGRSLNSRFLNIIIIDMRDSVLQNNKKKLIIVAVGGVLVVVAIVISLVLFFAPNDGSLSYSEEEKVEALLQDEEATPDTIIAELDYILEEKGVDEYINHFQTVIDATNDNELKAEYYLARARSLYDYGLQNGDLDVYKEQILADAKEAEELAPSIGSAYALYVYGGAFGESELAAHYEGLFDERSAEGVDAED